jgi:hypothetical protein
MPPHQLPGATDPYGLKEDELEVVESVVDNVQETAGAAKVDAAEAYAYDSFLDTAEQDGPAADRDPHTYDLATDTAKQDEEAHTYDLATDTAKQYEEAHLRLGETRLPGCR